jgi:RNA polymerase II subunit A-like phosphatase
MQRKQDVFSFTLPESPTEYHIKLRPGTREFLERVDKDYEMHIYTMGTRNYAHAIAAIIDPDQSYFKERILSRDESGSFVTKSIQRLFPCDQSMVVVVDDRGDVWNWSPNLIKVFPCKWYFSLGFS